MSNNWVVGDHGGRGNATVLDRELHRDIGELKSPSMGKDEWCEQVRCVFRLRQVHDLIISMCTECRQEERSKL